MNTIHVLPPLLASQHNLALGLLQWSSEQFSVLCPHNQPELSLKSSFLIPLLICLNSSNGFPRHLKRNLSSLPWPIQASFPMNFYIACLLCSKHIGLLPVSLSARLFFTSRSLHLLFSLPTCASCDAFHAWLLLLI